MTHFFGCCGGIPCGEEWGWQSAAEDCLGGWAEMGTAVKDVVGGHVVVSVGGHGPRLFRSLNT